MEQKQVYIQEGIKVSDKILDSLNIIGTEKNVIFVFEIPILNIIRSQPFDMDFFVKVSEIYGVEKTVNKFWGLLKSIYHIDKKVFIFNSTNQLDKYRNAVNNNLQLLSQNPKMHLLKDGKIIIEGMIKL